MAEQRAAWGPRGGQPFSLVDLADAAAAMRADAAASPVDLLPPRLLRSGDGRWRAGILVLFNAVKLLGAAPAAWKIHPIMPLLKPGKDRGVVQSYRPISLLSGLLKLYEYCLLDRIRGTVEGQLSPSQGGGQVGADAQAAALVSLVQVRRAQGRGRPGGGHTWMAYLDVEAAFCRASPALLLRELWEVGVVDEWHEIAALYEEVAAYAWYAGRATARWAVKAGVLQGSVLSPLLFNLYMNSLSDAVAAAGGGAGWVDASGARRRTDLLMYCDDAVLLAENAAALQRMLTAAAEWAWQKQMSFNVGPEKSAVAYTGDQGELRRAGLVSGGPDSRPLPPVGAYRYLGVPWVSRGFGGAGLVRALVERGDAKSGALAGWSRLSGLSLDLVAGVWQVAVLPALFGLAFVSPAACHGRTLDRAQRKWARWMLGWPKRTPAPAVTLEIGWPPLSAHAEAERCALWCRLVRPGGGGARSLGRDLVVAASGLPGTWAAAGQQATLARLGAEDHVVGAEGAVADGRAARAAILAAALAATVKDASESPLLAHYVPPLPAREGRFAPDRDLYRQRVPTSLARVVGGLRAGGVGLRAGDPASPPQPSVANCCTFCLLKRGALVAETLEHFVAWCPLHADRRRAWGAALPEGGQSAAWAPQQWLSAALDLSAEQQGWGGGRRATLEFWRTAWAARAETGAELAGAATMAQVVAGVHGLGPT